MLAIVMTVSIKRRWNTSTNIADEKQGIGAAQDAVRMQNVVKFYEKLPRGPAPAPQPRGLLQRYQARYFGDKPSGARTCISNGPVLKTSYTDRARKMLIRARYSNRPRHCGARSPRLRPELLFPSP